MDLAVPLLIAFFLGIPVLKASTLGLNGPKHQILFRVMLITFGLRVALATIFESFQDTRVFHQDAASYEAAAAWIARSWGDNSMPRWDPPARNFGVTYLFAGVMYVFGRYPLNLTVFTSVIGTLCVALVYRIGLTLFHQKIAQRALMFAAFFPSMIVWSAMALKDPIMALLILCTLYYCLKLRDKFSAKHVVGTLLPIICVYPIRFYTVYFLVVSVVGTLWLARRGKVAAGVSKQLAIGLCVLLLVGAFGMSNVGEDAEYFDLQRISSYRNGMAITANSGFSTGVDVSTPFGALLFLPIGITTIIWSPFPWQMVSFGPLSTLPEMLVWWAAMPALLRGVRFALKNRFREMSPILVFSAIVIVGYGLTMGNVGAAFRMRSQVLNLLFLFSSLGHYLEVVRRKKLSPDILFKNPRS